MTFQKTYSFLKELENNNNRDWFMNHKNEFKESEIELKNFLNELKEKMNQHDFLDESKTRIYRIYRDVRFSNDKTPYKTNRSGSFARATTEKRGGYYFSISPGASFVAGGFFGPNSQDLLHIRKQISQDPDPLVAILKSSNVTNVFGSLIGDQVKTAPKGFSKDDPAISLLRYKQLILQKSFSDQEVLASTFVEVVDQTYQSMRPFFNYMSEILTTDLNGESLLTH